MFKVYIDRGDELLPIEECSHCNFNADSPSLKLEDLNLLIPDSLISFENLDNILPVLFVADKEKALNVLCLSARLYGIFPRGCFYKLDCLVKILELFVGDNWDPMLL